MGDCLAKKCMEKPSEMTSGNNPQKRQEGKRSVWRKPKKQEKDIRTPRTGREVMGSKPHNTGGHNKPLNKERSYWMSRSPITESQLCLMRNEFWDTMPSYSGYKEIWDALRAAAQAHENSNHELAQAILDGAGITLPQGSLTYCYDELGNRYELPIYCLSCPLNLINEHVNEDVVEWSEPQATYEEEFPLKLRLSTGRDLQLRARMTSKIYELKRQLQDLENIDVADQRWVFSGKLLADNIQLQDTKMQKDFVIQVIVK